jgi:S1-C subfamily serine protease
MKRLLPVLMGFALLLLSSTEGWSLPPCPEDQNERYHNCFGTYTWAGGDKYVGEWKDNKKHGQGTFTVGNLGSQGKFAGDKYVGELKDDKFHGQGTYTYADGRIKEGIWENNKFQYAQKITPTVTARKSPEPSSRVQSGLPRCPGSPETVTNGKNFYLSIIHSWNDCTGTYSKKYGLKILYVGNWKQGKYHGLGTTTLKNLTFTGYWKQGLKHGKGVITYTDGRVEEGIWRNDNRRLDLKDSEFKYAKKPSPTVIAKKSPEPSSQVQRELARLKKKIAQLEKEKKQKPKPKPIPKSATSGSGFFISRLGHVLANQHVVNDCKKVTVGDNSKKQVNADVLETDRRNDLALLKISSMQMASAETKTLVAKLGLTVTPLASQGLLRPDAVELGEDVVVAGFPFGDIFSNTIKITTGVVSARRGLGDDSGQFQIDAAVQHGSSGGPIYDENGNIIGVVVSQLNKLKVAKAIGSLPELVNFGIKASTVKQFLNSSGLPSSWSRRSKRMSTKDIAKIAENQTVMVVCHR